MRALAGALLMLALAGCTEPEGKKLVFVMEPKIPDAGPPAKPKYPGPLGLSWGANSATTKAELQKRFTYSKTLQADHGETTMQLYGGGMLLDLPVQKVEADLCSKTDELGSVGVIFSNDDARPLRWRWQHLVEGMTSQFGPPTERKVPFEAVATASDNRSLLLKRAHPLDMDTEKLVDLAQPIFALWEFDGQVAVSVSVVFADPDRRGVRDFALVWNAMNLDLAKRCGYTLTTTKGPF